MRTWASNSEHFSQPLIEYFICLFILVEWSITDSHQDICPRWPSPWFSPINSQPYCHPPRSSRQPKRSVTTQGFPTTSPPLPIPSEEFISIHCSTPVMWVIPTCFHDGNNVKDFLLQNGFQLLLFVVRAACISVDALQLGYWSWHFYEGRSPNSYMTILRSCCHMDLHPLPPWDGNWRTLLAHFLSNIGVVPPGLCLVSLVLSLSTFKSCLNLFQWTPLTPVWRSFSCFETGVPHLLSAGLVSCKPTHDQNYQKSAGDTRLRARYRSAGSSCFFLHSVQLEG